MDSQTPKLSLDLRPPCLDAGELERKPKRSPELRDYVAGLEDELRKIEAFKRELPLSVEIINDAIVKLKREVVRNDEESKVVCSFDEIVSDADGDKKSWMSSAQLWSSDQTLSLPLDSNKPGDRDSGQACKYGGVLSSFSAGTVSPPVKEEVANKLALAGPGFCLVNSELAGVSKAGVPGGRPSSGPVVTEPPKFRFHSPQEQGPRKQRRCWSPELHRRFTDALDKLGGSQVATPKQIRDLMKVDGLTNDEVKSHLQKYRLHIRKLPNSAMKTSELEGNGVSKVEASQSGSPQGPLHLTLSSAKCNSPISRCDSMEYDYGEKSDSHSWGGE